MCKVVFGYLIGIEKTETLKIKIYLIKKKET
jgi:hypothetical protein